ncbi:hypothetical protein KUH03_22985 [Sphingobacterium sp. E70]|uniref:hypothetical protein n=1 Tax=Sphingobacterium sp. E70 TaxID=2853439 RepID=UPI00211C5974|nr:hypothetical protein [Sphingobacterium sp. E70]ULT22310.1 hypothetical protein KUH03_22985 [Sphingobacterium sp. E70]
MGTNYYQPFSMPANVFPKDVKIVVDGRKLKLGEQALIEAASPSVNGKFMLTEITVPTDPVALDQLIHNPLFKDKFLVVDERAALATMKADQFRMTLLRLASGVL